jgi:hypothetical protein
MKRFCISLLLILCVSAVLPAQRGIRSIYRKHKRAGTENVHFMVPRPAFWIASIFPRHRDERKLVRAVKNVRLLVAEGEVNMSTEETKKMLKRAESAGYEPLLFVRDGNTRVSINAKERKGRIRGLFIVVQEPDEFVLISMKTKLRITDVEKLIKRMNEEKKLNDVKIPVLVPIGVKNNTPQPESNDQEKQESSKL